MTIDYLIVGGGGSGYAGTNADWLGGGGGGGGVKAGTASISPGSFSVTVGAGGTLSDNTGGASTFNSITADGGGLGGGVNNAYSIPVNGNDGASGGGGSYYSGYPGTGGTGTTGEGYDGSVAVSSAGGCGGGATQAGHTDATTPANGYGGQGYTSSINGTSDVYGSGGGGGRTVYDGSQGLPGGTNAGSGAGGANGSYPQTPATNPVANKGGGGGGRAGGGGSSTGAAGVVIVRYKTGDFGANSSGGAMTYITSSGVNYTVHTFTASGTLVLMPNSGGFLMFMP